MATFLANLHQLFGYALFVGMLAVAVLGFVQGARGSAYDARPFRAVAGLVSLQLLIGIGSYVASSTWDQDRIGVVVVHPLLMLLAVGLAHAAVARGARTEVAAESWRGAGTLLAISVVFVTAGIGIASAA